MAMAESCSGMQVQVKFKTADEKYSVADTTFSVPLSIQPDGLNNLVKKLLAADESSLPEFDFFLLDDLLRGSLSDFLEGRDDITQESVLDILYQEKREAPKPQKNVNHDDWVAGVGACNGLILSACYDNTVNLWSAVDGSKKLTIPGHSGPVRAVAFIHVDPNTGDSTFTSASHDQTVILYRYVAASNSVECMNVGKGHARSVECVAVDPTKKHVASGSFDTMLKIWSANLTAMLDEDKEDGQSETKKARSNVEPIKKPPTRTPLLTLAGHKECISGVAWLDSATDVVSASWDHTLRVWDAETSSLKTELVGNKAFFGVTYSPERRMLLTAACERTVRMYDPRSTDGLLVKSAYASHQGWVTCVDWCKGSDQLFVSGSHDSLLKMWDVRSCKTPLYDLSGHSDQVLCCSWAQPDIVVSGGSDNDMKIFQSNQQQKSA